MPTYEISSYGFFTSNYEVTNVKDEDDEFEAEQDFFNWGYRAVMEHEHHRSIEISENWDWSFNLLDKSGTHFATIERSMDCCSPEYYEVVKIFESDSHDHDTAASNDENVWFTIHEDEDEWIDPDLIFRRVDRHGKATKVAKLSTESNLCWQEYRLHVSSIPADEIPTIVATSIVIVRILERRKRQEQQQLQQHHNQPWAISYY